MASNRHLGRIVALQTLYEYEFRKDSEDDTADIKEILSRNLERYETAIDDTKFVEALVTGVLKEQTAIDEKIQPIAPDRDIEHAGSISRGAP